MIVPEWEMEETIMAYPELLDPGEGITSFKIHSQQYYLPGCGGYIDILASIPDSFLIIELKNEFVDNLHVITDQLSKYQAEMQHHPACRDRVKCLLVSTHGFSTEVKEAAQQNGIMLQVLPIKQLMIASEKVLVSDNTEKLALRRLLQRRLHLSKLDDVNGLLNNHINEGKIHDVESVKRFVQYGEHDEHGLEMLATTFRRVSERAAIMAHRVFDTADCSLKDDEEKWFWLFYSVLDRRANAATFVKARHALESVNLFLPSQIVSLVDNVSYEEAIRILHSILHQSQFPLSFDSVRHELAMPCSIVDAALYMKKFNYSFDAMLGHFQRLTNSPYNLTNIIVKDLMQNIYGVGKRISAQIVRGLTLKGRWNLNLQNPQQLEKCDYNEFFAGNSRLGLVSSPDGYEQELGIFASNFLEGNCGIVSHVLWYIRKRFCLRMMLCNLCPVAGFCLYHRKQLLHKRTLSRHGKQLSLFYY